MAENSAIQWTHHTFNPWRGCSKVHAGCTHCYAETNMSVKLHGIKWGPNGTRVRASDAMWKEPLKWNREAEQAGERRRVFCASLADVFEDWQGRVLDHRGNPLCVNDSREVYAEGIPSELPDGDDYGQRALTLDDLRRRLFYVIDKTPNLDWLLLTKRPENVRRMWGFRFDQSEARRLATDNIDAHPYYRPNVWLGTSVSDQATADKMIPELLKCRHLCPVLFLSAEPLLGPLNLDGPFFKTPLEYGHQRIGWVIVGGESGKDARRCRLEWIESIVKQCGAAGVPCFVKQLGSAARYWDDFADGFGGMTGGGGDANYTTNHPKGGDPSEWPDSVRVRQFPVVQAV